MIGGEATPRLERLLRSRLQQQSAAAPSAAASPPRAVEACELCAAPIGPGHRHLLELDQNQLRCVCSPCSILFDRREAAMGRYRLIPDRVLRLDGFRLGEERWADLAIPVGLAYFVVGSRDAKVRAFYPGAMGAVESRLGLEAWNELARENPVLDLLEPDVEALLIRRLASGEDSWLVPLETCFELVAILRTRWSGLTGGQRVWQEIESFFASLERRARAVDRDGRRVTASQSLEEERP